jgi:hypothetical protein
MSKFGNILKQCATKSSPRKYISHEELATIPGLIHARREGKSGKELAYLVMQELCIGLLVYMPLRQRDLRESKIGDQDAT